MWVVLGSVPLWLCLLAPWVSARLFWPLSLLAIGFPYVWVCTLPVALWCLWRRRWRWLMWPGVALVLSLGHLPSFWGWHSQSPGRLRILSMNCRYFDALSTNTLEVKRNIDACKPIWQLLRPDLACVQDFSTSSQEDNERAEFFVRLDMKLRYFMNCEASLVGSYSRTPIYSYHWMMFPDTFNSYSAVDIKLDGRMLRVYNLHLQSYQFERDKSWRKTAVGVYGRLRKGLQMRADQADIVAQDIAASPYPVVVCGDFNDVPGSYVYSKVAGSLQDGFRQRGRGWAFTYAGPIPGLRIDSMLCSQELRFTGYQTVQGPSFLDHRWIVGDLVWRD